MKRILTLILVMASIILPMIAEGSKEKSNKTVIKLEIRQQPGKPTMLRAPMRINVEAYYNTESNAIDISYDGEAAGEVFIYHNGNIIGYDSAINTSIPLPTATGIYDIEICGEHWGAYGRVQL